MAAGEFVSVHSQADTEAANLDLQAALVSAASFAVGAAMPLFATVIVSGSGVADGLVHGVALWLTLLGGLTARAGGAGMGVGALRVTFWGALAMAITAGVGATFATLL